MRRKKCVSRKEEVKTLKKKNPNETNTLTDKEFKAIVIRKLMNLGTE